MLRLPEKPHGVKDFTLNTHVGDEWDTNRYANRKSADFLANWVVTDPDVAALGSQAERRPPHR